MRPVVTPLLLYAFFSLVALRWFSTMKRGAR
jgi:hypothetical protein